MTDSNEQDSRPQLRENAAAADAEREEVAEVDDQLDAEADGEGLGAEAGRGEEMGLAEG